MTKKELENRCGELEKIIKSLEAQLLESKKNELSKYLSYAREIVEDKKDTKRLENISSNINLDNLDISEVQEFINEVGTITSNYEGFV